MKNNTINKKEIEKFSRIAEEWWNPNGKFKPLHKFNPIRIEYIKDNIIKTLKLNNKNKPLEKISILDIGCGGGLLSEPMCRMGAIVTGIDANGCQNTDITTVIVNMLPNVYAGADQTLCEGESTVLSGTGAVSYQWNNGITNNQAFNAMTTTTYIVTGTDINGCVNTDDVNVNVLLWPIVSINASGPTSFCEGDSVLLTSVSESGMSYQWYQNSSPISGAITSSQTAYNSGTFRLTANNSNLCFTSDSISKTKLPETYFDQKAQGGNRILRAIHYPPIKEHPKEAERAAAHSDINLITLLMIKIVFY